MTTLVSSPSRAIDTRRVSDTLYLSIASLREEQYRRNIPFLLGRIPTHFTCRARRRVVVNDEFHSVALLCDF